MRSLLTTTIISTVCTCVFLSNAFAADAQYTILNPAPHDALRPLHSDTEDRVITPYTVDAGHFQLESDLISYATASDSFDVPAGHVESTSDLYSWSPRVKVGLCDRADFEVHFGYAIANADATLSTPAGTTFHFKNNDDGWGSVIPKVKVNLWGNDGGTTALAIAPYVSIPTHGSRDITGGVGLPFTATLPQDFSLKIYPELFVFENSHHTLYGGFDGDAALHKTVLQSQLDLFVNFHSLITSQTSMGWVGYTGFGAGYNITSDFQAYFGLQFGLTSNAYDYNPYVGLTWRY